MSLEELKKINDDAENSAKSKELESFEAEIARAKKNGIDTKKYEEELAKIKESTKKSDPEGKKELEKDPSKKDEENSNKNVDNTSDAIKKVGEEFTNKMDAILEKLSNKEAEEEKPATPLYG